MNAELLDFDPPISSPAPKRQEASYERHLVAPRKSDDEEASL